LPITDARSTTARSSSRRRSRRDQRVDRRRHDDIGTLCRDEPSIALAPHDALVDQHAHRLADEQRVALGRLEHARGEALGQVDASQHLVDERAAL
jgi:hypothetical protein